MGCPVAKLFTQHAKAMTKRTQAISKMRDCVVELVGLEPTTKVLWNMVGVRPTTLVGHPSRLSRVLLFFLIFRAF